MEQKEDLLKINDKIMNDLKTICATDTYLLFKSLLKLIKYENSIIPVDNHIFLFFYESIQNDDYSMDASELISLYYKKSGPIYSISSLFHLVDFSIETEKIRTRIWFLLIKLIFIYKYVLPSNYLNEMFKIFDQLKTIDKYLFTQIILVMLASNNHENHKIIKDFFLQNNKFLKEVLYICAEGENVTTITTILNLIQSFPNFNYFYDLIDYCKCKSESQNINLLIYQFDN